MVRGCTPRVLFWVALAGAACACGPPREGALPLVERRAEGQLDHRVKAATQRAAGPRATDPAPPPGCRLEAPTLLHRASRGRGVALALQHEKGLVAFVDGEAIRVVPIGADGAPNGPARPLTPASAEEPVSGLLGLGATGSAFVLVARHACGASSCATGFALDDRGRLLARSPALPFPMRPRTRKHSAARSGFFVAYSDDAGGRGVIRWRASGRKLEARRFPLGPQPDDADLPAEVLALKAHARGFVAVVRRGPAEHPASQTWLVTPRRAVHLEELEDVLAIESLVLPAPGRLLLVGAFEFAAPTLLDMDLRRVTPRSALRLPQGSDPPAALRGERRVVPRIDLDGLWVVRRDGLGFSAGPPVWLSGQPLFDVALAHRAVAANVQQIQALWRSTTGRVVTRQLRCRLEP